MRSHRVLAHLMLIAPCLLHCATRTGDNAPQLAPQSAPSEHLASEPRPDALAANDRMLSPNATFADLVSQVETLESKGLGQADAGCLLGGGHEAQPSFELAGDLAPAIRPLGTPPETLDPAWLKNPPVGILTRWGLQSDGTKPEWILTALTATPPQAAARPVLVVVLDTSQAYLLPTPDTGATRPHSLEDLVPILVERVQREQPSVWVTATADVPLARIRSVLASIPQTAPAVALAMALPAGTRLPASSPPASDQTAATCPGGLPAVAGDRPQGDLDASQLSASLGPLRAQAAACLTQASGSVARGGAIRLAARISEHGTVERVCVVQTALDDGTLRGCLIEALRSVQFPAPEPPGYVDFELPLSLTPTAVASQRPLCD